jgi:NADPH:quinone reductase
VLQFGDLPDSDGPVTGITVLIHGRARAVGTLVAQLARWAGATVVGHQGTRADRAHAMAGSREVSARSGRAPEAVHVAGGAEHLAAGGSRSQFDLVPLLVIDTPGVGVGDRL